METLHVEVSLDHLPEGTCVVLEGTHVCVGDVSVRDESLYESVSSRKRPRGDELFMNEKHLSLCGMNAINHLFGRKVVTIESMNKALDHAEMTGINDDLRPKGKRNKGDLHCSVINHLLQTITKHNWRRLHSIMHCSKIDRLDPGKMYFIYGWHSVKPFRSGHYVAVREGLIFNDEYKSERMGGLNWSGRVQELNISNLENAFYGHKYTLIKVWEVYDMLISRVKTSI